MHCLLREHYRLLTIPSYLRTQFQTNTLFCLESKRCLLQHEVFPLRVEAIEVIFGCGDRFF